MSYAVTEAGEQDMRSEMNALEKLNADIDQLSSEANDCGTLAPKLKTALNLAWFLAEEAMREVSGGSCGHVEVTLTPYCCCCAHFAELQVSTQMIRRIL